MIIGITGKSGVGKTTLTNYLNEKIENSTAISVDNIDVNIIMNHKDELIELYGKEIIKNERINFNMFFESKENVDKIHDITRSEFINFVLNTISSASSKYLVIIVDWFLLPNYEELWNMCNCHILVKSKNEEKMWEKLIVRDTARRLETKKSFKDIYKVLDKHYPIFSAFEYDEIFENNFDESFEAKAENFIKKFIK